MNLSQKNFDILNFDKFIAQYMGNDEQEFVHENQAIQIFPLSVATIFIKPPIPLFRAEYSFLLLFSEGGGRQQVDDKLLDLKANDALFIRAGHLNGIKTIAPTTDGFYIYLDNSILPQIFSNSSSLNSFTFNPKHSVEKNEMEWLCKCCNLFIEQKRLSLSSLETQASLVKAIVSRLAVTWPSKLYKPERQSEVAMLFKELLYENFLHKRDVKFYAESLAVSENYLNRCVKRVTNKPTKQHINELLINHSKILLQDNSKDISQVAYELNFSDPSYFGKVFKQLTTHTPSQYRNMILQDSSDLPHDSS